MRSFHLLGERRQVTYTIILGVWSMVAVYAILHDQYIVRIAPEHFTIYHKPLWGILEPKLLAAAYAFRASFGPGLVLGMACAFVARAGDRPKVGYGFIFLGTSLVILATEILSVSAGLICYYLEEPLFPSAWYPDPSLPMLVTNTIQITCYLASALCSLLFLCQIGKRRLLPPR